MTDEERLLNEAGALEDETDELLQAVQTLERSTGERQTELITRIESCQTQLNNLAQSLTTPTENPLLTQILTQLAEIKADCSNLKQSLDTMRKNPEPNASEEPVPVVVVTPEPVTPNQEELTDEHSVENVDETPEPTPERRRNRFI